MSQTIIIRPILSEKMARLEELQRQYAFEISKDANKLQVKEAIESRFEVHVTSVRIMNINGKVKRTTMRSGGRAIRTEGARASWKKAIVTLMEGEKIDLFQGEQAV